MRGMRGCLKRGISPKIQEGLSRENKLSGLGGFLPMYHAPRGKGFFLPWAGKIGFFVQGPVCRRKTEFSGYARCFFA